MLTHVEIKPELSENLELIIQVIESLNGDSDQFADTLKRNHIPHISFSQITSVEFCPYKYYLEYVEMVELDPPPMYFTKGRLLHQIIAKSYQKIDHHESLDIDEYDNLIDNQLWDVHNQHLKNAVRVHLDNLWSGCQVIAVEKPFVMILDEALPPCVGIIDLILQQNGRMILIDHKTGRDFYPQDVLQMAIYAEYISRQFGTSEIAFYYDHYRWVNNLDRIRKPAIQRTEMVIPSGYFKEALNRIQNGYQKINNIMTTHSAAKHGECFRCPYRTYCRY